MRSPGDYRKLFPHGPHSSKNNFFGIKISQRRDWECPSIKNPVCEGYIPKNLVAKISLTESMDTEDLAQLKTLRLDVQEFKGLIGLGFCLKYNKIEINITSKIVSFSISIYKVLTF